jgi:hypothetical protein
MSQLRTPSISASEDRRIERTIVAVLLTSSAGSPWTTDELVLELAGEPVATLDGIDRLQRAGIVHRCREFVFPTRAAKTLDEVLR